MTAYYNENDPVAAEWLRRLIARGLIAPGEVDERDIRDVAPAELVRFTQCHFFAGIGIWSLALRQAGWPDDRPIWTGSCPCQPFSAAGAGDGFADERHLWPHWHWLIQHCRPGVIVGEQVAGKDGLGWNDLVSADLGGIGYASGAVITCAAGFGMDWRGSAESERLERAIQLCPDPMVARHMASFAEWADSALGFGGSHIRERQYFFAHDGVGHPDGARTAARLPEPSQWQEGVAEIHDYRGHRLSGPKQGRPSFERGPLGLADGDGGDAPEEREQRGGQQRLGAPNDGDGRSGNPRLGDIAHRGMAASPGGGRRGDLDWLFCRDGEWRPVEPGTFPLADAHPGRMGRLRAYGNALDVETATRFSECVMELLADLAA